MALVTNGGAGSLNIETDRPIRQIFLHVTKACNLHCGYCYYSARRASADELGTQEITALWPDVVALAPHKIVFTGGEPLLRADLAELVDKLAALDEEHRILRCLNTNGVLVTRALAKSLPPRLRLRQCP